MTAADAFEIRFTKLMGFQPFRWQQRLYHEYFLPEKKLPKAIDLPTGLGKTSVMAIWYLAREANASLPRRLVYVVDRRAVVDQATSEAEKIANRAEKDPPRISTLRGQYADNGEWRNDPAAPAIIVGTVDMIGSRLLFSGYGVSTKMRPYHAGLLGADTLVVLDEAHLVPPFEALLKAIASDQVNGLKPRSEEDRNIVPRLCLMSLSATGRETGGEVFRLGEEDYKDPVVRQRLDAEKRLSFDQVEAKELVPALAERAWKLGNGECPARVLVYCNSREDALAVKKELEDKYAKNTTIATQLLVGERRVRERNDLSKWLEAHGFLRAAKQPPVAPTLPTFLFATSAGEVGVDLDADHMVCDLVEWERMVQRLGRVNRRGDEGKKAEVEVIAAPPKGKDGENWEDRLVRLKAPLDALPALEGGGRDASPGAIAALKKNEALRDMLEKAQTPEPLRPALTRALVDAWSMTSLEEHTGRPDIQPWLRGWVDDDKPQATLVWRRHLPVRQKGPAVTPEEIDGFFEAAPPHLSERLEAAASRIVDWLIERAVKVLTKAGNAEEGAAHLLTKDSLVLFILDRKSSLVRHPWSLSKLAALGEKPNNKDKDDFRKNLAGCTLVVSSKLGGLKDGMLADDANGDVSAMDADASWPERPFWIYDSAQEDAAERGKGKVTYRFATEMTEEGEGLRWLVVEERPDQAESEDSRSLSRRNQLLEVHQSRVASLAGNLASELKLPAPYARMLTIAARLHDEGKRSEGWQRAFNAPGDGQAYAKTKGPLNPNLLNGYRHEFGSLPEVEKDKEFQSLDDGLKDLALHLVAAHHGNARPLISTQGCEDGPPFLLEARACEVALRFARLQKRWGPWGLAWWESLLRAVDQRASRENDEPKGAAE